MRRQKNRHEITVKDKQDLFVFTVIAIMESILKWTTSMDKKNHNSVRDKKKQNYFVIYLPNLNNLNRKVDHPTLQYFSKTLEWFFSSFVSTCIQTIFN